MLVIWLHEAFSDSRSHNMSISLRVVKLLCEMFSSRRFVSDATSSNRDNLLKLASRRLSDMHGSSSRTDYN